jgi:HK97 family phage prohead protease
MPDLERRAGQKVDLKDDNGKVKVQGYAAVFNARANIAGVFEEVIEPGAFTEAITRDDVVFLADHTGMPMARTRSGTLKLSQDDHGLFIETELDTSDPDSQRVVAKMRRGDLDKMSFAFYADVEELDTSGNLPVRTIKKASLVDVSVVTWPAYDQTEIAIRSMARLTKKNSNLNHNIKSKLSMRLSLAEKS